MRYGLRVGDDGDPLGRGGHGAAPARRASAPRSKRRIILGTYALSAATTTPTTAQAQKVRTLIARDFAAAFEQVDVLVSPTAPTTAFPLGEQARRPAGDVPQRRRDDPVQPRRQRRRCRCRSGSPPRTACRSACRSWRRRWPTTGSTASAPRSRRRCSTAGAHPLLAEAPALEVAPMTAVERPGLVAPTTTCVARYDPVLGLEVHVELGTATKMFCGCPTAFGAEPNTPDLPDLPRPARRAAGRSTRAAVESTIRIGLALQLLDRVVVPLRAEELLLPGHAEELPDLAVRRADRVDG